MKIKMQPLHGGFATKGQKSSTNNMSIGLKKDSDKKMAVGLSMPVKQTAKAQTPMCKKSVAMDGYAGKSTPKGASGMEAKAPKTAKPMYR